MPRRDRSAVALAASLLLHSAALAAGFVEVTTREDARDDLVRDAWSADSVEVGTVPDRSLPRSAAATPPTPATAPAPAPREATTSAPVVAPEALDSIPNRPATAAPAASRAAERGRVSPPARARPLTSAAPASSATPLASAASSAPANSETDPAAGSFGGMRLPIGVLHLGKAFARALSTSSYGDSAWSELPLGTVGRAVVRIEIDAEGRLAEFELDPEVATPPVLRRMIDRAMVLLRNGTFSLEPRRVSSGTERFALEVSISELAPSADESANPRHLRAQGHEAPTRLRPGYARFTLNSGRHVDARVAFAEP